MSGSSPNSPGRTRTFSHIYIEREAYDYNMTQKILSANRNAQKITIGHYKDVFCRAGQNFALQKLGPKLILAVNRDTMLYDGSALCDSFGHTNFKYATHVMNCPYDCEYCYLSGMYRSANMVVFVNIDDYFDAVAKIIPAYVCVSYDTDLLALEGMTGILAKWIEFCAENKEVEIEIRTKSGSYRLISGFKPLNNVVLAWTLSPQEIIDRFERGAPSLSVRLQNIKAAIGDGWRVRICMDPIIATGDWKEIYDDGCRTISEELEGLKLETISVGTFRVPSVFYKKMRRARPNSALLSYPFENRNGVMRYDKAFEDEMIKIGQKLL